MAETFIEREFAGETRRFQLIPARRELPGSGYETARFGNLSELVARAMSRSLGAERIRHVLSHALAGRDPVKLAEAEAIVEAEMQGMPLAGFEALAVEVISAAYVGADGDGQG